MIFNIEPETKVKEGCLVPTGVFYAISNQGVQATLVCPIYSPTGDIADLTDASMAEIRLRPCDEPGLPLALGENVVIDKETSKVSFQLPKEIFTTAGIYSVDIGLFAEGAKYPALINCGYLLVERTAFTAFEKRGSQMPRIDDIRQILADYSEENTLWKENEFSSGDIIQALLQPVRYWNAATPNLQFYTFSPSTFPFMEPWMRATAGYLCRRAVTHYMRNKLLTAHAGIQGDDLNRNQEYQQYGEILLSEWRQWVAREKRALNVHQFSGALRRSIHAALPTDINQGRWIS